MSKKKYKPAKLTKPKGDAVTSMDAVALWAFEKETHPQYTHLRQLLEPKSDSGIKNFIEQKFPELSAKEQNELRVLLKKSDFRNARIHSRKVLDFMVDLILHNSIAPPPWRS